MKTFDVYPLYDIVPVKALHSNIWDENGTKYTDLYGGHAVISIGHSHPVYVKAIQDQLAKLGFYSNSVQIPLQQTVAEKLTRLAGLPDYKLFFVNSGAEANENALKLASFHTGRKKVIAFRKAFHGRTSAAVAATDNPKIKSLINDDSHVEFLPFNDVQAVRNSVDKETCAVIVEGIQGVGGIHVASDGFLRAIRDACNEQGAVFIHDSVQCGYGRSGAFFSFGFSGVRPDIISMAKGMGNGFPVGGILISPKFKAQHGMLGTTFGGNPLACAAANAVLDVIENEKLIENAAKVGSYAIEKLKALPNIKEVRGMGLMIGIELNEPVKEIRQKLLFEEKLFTGVSGTHTIRLLPSLGISTVEIDRFLAALNQYL